MFTVTRCSAVELEVAALVDGVVAMSNSVFIEVTRVRSAALVPSFAVTATMLMRFTIATVAKYISYVTEAGYFTNSFIIELVIVEIIKLKNFLMNQRQQLQITVVMVDLALFIIIKHS